VRDIVVRKQLGEDVVTVIRDSHVTCRRAQGHSPGRENI
jgi:hypothetical protein